MKFSCDQCQAQYMIADEKVGAKGVKVRCKKCGHIIPVTRDQAASADAVAATAAAAAAPAQPGLAFDDVFGGGGSGADGEERAPTKVFSNNELEKVRQEQALARGGDESSSASAEQQVASSSRAEWYVAVNDEQVGPVTIEDIAQRWDRGDLSPASLAWKAGLADWAPMSGIAEFGSVVTRSQAQKESPAGQPKAEEKKEQVTWRPSGASALADLAKEATVEEPKKQEVPQSPFGMDFNPHAAGGGAGADPFGGETFAGAAAAGPSTVWQFPTATAKKSSGTPKWLIGAVVAMALIMVVGGMLFALGIIPPKAPPALPPVAANYPPPQQPVASPPPVTPPQGAQQVGGVRQQQELAGQANPGQPSATPTPTPVTPTPAPTNPPPAPTPKPDAGEKVGKQGGKAVKVSKGSDGDKPAANPKGGKDDPMEGVFSSPKKEVKTQLERSDVLDTVKANLDTIKACTDAYARGGGKLPTKLIAKWVIKPSGFTDSQEMASPELKGTPVEGCVASAIKKWHFPESKGTTPVTFPLPIAQ